MSDYECVICLEEAGPRDLELHSTNRMIRLCMSACECNGFVHVKCLKDWVSRDESTNKTKCPICRTRGENFTLLECETLTIPMYQPPIITSYTEQSSTPSPNIILTPQQPYHYPVSANPTQQPQSVSSPETSIVIINETNRQETRGFNMEQAQEEERRRHKILRERVGFTIFLIIILVILIDLFSKIS